MPLRLTIFWHKRLSVTVLAQTVAKLLAGKRKMDGEGLRYLGEYLPSPQVFQEFSKNSKRRRFTHINTELKTHTER
jgi:hypothetical protein